MTRKQLVTVALRALRADLDADQAVIDALVAETSPSDGEYGQDDVDEDGLVDQIVSEARDQLRS